MGFLFLVVCLASALAVVLPLQETDIDSEVLADISSDSTLVRLQRATSKNESNVTTSDPPPSAFEVEPESAKLNKHQRLAIILRNLQKNLDDLNALVKKGGGKSKKKRKGGRRRRKNRRTRKESDEELDEESSAKKDD